MSYIVLARRWRPQQFKDLIGQNHVSQTLANAIDSNHIAHSFIFAGPRGVGKTTTARILAKALNCEKGPSSTPCNECSNCMSITKGNSLDVLEIDGASNRGIDEIRNLRENIRFTPSQGKYRIYIIDEVHMLTKEAFNALLKTLEEPPSHTIFIFATTEIHRVPATILSRCQRFDFKRISTKTIIEHLQHICQSDKIEIEPDALLYIAKKADGSMRDAQSILDQIIAFSGEKISTLNVTSALGIIAQELFFELSAKIRNGESKDLLIIVQRIISDGYDLGEFLSGFEEHLRNLLVTKSLGHTDLLHLSEHYLELYLKESVLFEEYDLLRYMQLVSEIQNNIRWSTQPQLKFELGLLKMAKMLSVTNLETILEKLELIKKKTVTEFESGPALVPEPIAAISVNALPPELNFENATLYWNELTEIFKNTKVNLSHAMDFGQPSLLDENKLIVDYKKSNSFHIGWFKKNHRLIEDSYNQHFHKSVKIEINEIDDTVDSPNQNNATKSKNEMAADPSVMKLIEELGLELT